jgi:hypothetical protein
MKQFFVTFLFFAFVGYAGAQGNDSTVALIKKNLAQRKEGLKKYEWIETTVTYMKGKEKSRSQNRCYYDATGKLTKVATGGGTPPPDKKGGLRGKVVANKTEDIQAYMKKCEEKVHAYLPPDAAKIQQISGAGKSVVHVLEPAKKVKLDFPDYLQKGDLLGISIDKEQGLLMGISVNSYIEKPEHKVNFEVMYTGLPDGIQYAGETTLHAPAKEIKVVIQNSGFKKVAG